MIEPGAKQFGLKRVGLATLLLDCAEIGIDRPLRGDPGELLLPRERPTIRDPLRQEGSRDEPTCLQRR